MGNDTINREYRNADIQRWQEMDFVVGYEIHTSNNPSKNCDLCLKLAGKYPKAFDWNGWHADCKCYITSILQDEETFDEQELSDLSSALYGTEYKKLQAKNSVKYVPKEFTDWFLDNIKQFNETNTIPDFVTNNIQLIISSHEYYKH
ncbi:MAG: hypothetical protein LBU91_08150 [Bacteroidales bacterium]|jgi:hypothetical protein|nr:hypothetical protein [Bacteroidales bacterium]